MEGEVAVRPSAVSIPSTDSKTASLARPGSPVRLTEEDGDNCRICRGEGTAEQPLFYPCKCSGSIRFVHQECLMEWLAHSQKKYCELCKTPFTFTKLYDNSMPSTLPLALFIQQVTIHSVEAILRNTRYAVVTLVWLCWLPWSIRQVWRGLFWLADGSWVTKSQLQEAALSRLAAVGGSDINTTIAGLYTGAPEAISGQLHLQTSLFSGFVGLFTGDFLLVELAKLIFPSISRWSHDLVSSDAADDPVILLTMDRQPSLLSNVAFVSSLTKFRLLNGALVDVLEGQLICLLIVVAFILVFLIREWVINQQPIANMPDPDNAADVPDPGNAQDDVARAARRRRRALRRRNNEHQQVADGPVLHAQLLGARPFAGPRPRHRHNINVEDARTNEAVAATHPAVQEASADGLEVESPLQTPSEAGSAGSDSWVDEYDRNDARPPLPARSAFNNIANIRQSIEEGNFDPLMAIGLDESNNPREPIASVPNVDLPTVVNGSSQAVSEVFDSVESHTLDSLFYSYTPIVEDGPSDSIAVETSRLRADASNSSSEQSLEVLDEQTAQESEIWIAGEPNEINSIYETTSIHSILTDTPEISTEIPNADSVEEGPATPAKRSLLDKVCEWCWHLDENERTPPAETEAFNDNEHIVYDPAAEAPFVPVHNREANADPPALEAPPAPVPEPNMLFGVDLNNPDAMEDAEDLDGILELIGMQGPLAGMVQNVIFSEFLITLTIAASVWLPYIWGKIALLILANPVGVFIRAPLFLASKFADFAVDLAIFVTGLLTLSIASSIKTVAGLVGGGFEGWHVPELVNTMSSDMTKASGTRLEDTLSKALTGLRPDLPTFSLRAHYALKAIQHQLQDMWSNSDDVMASWFDAILGLKSSLDRFSPLRQNTMQDFVGIMVAMPRHLTVLVLLVSKYVRESLSRLNASSQLESQAIDVSLARWNAKDKLLAIALGYVFFACIGYIYLGIARLVSGLRSEERVEGIIADSLRQAGGVMKVMVIIGIEMIVFPLYCGLLLDAALMPLFEGVTLQTRINFMLRAPVTGVFVHWFIGTCYMFHFALFVSMCRKIFRKGVLYFIRDPDDPTFHPVRDVLERPVMTQLGKIAFSGFIYGGLVYLCLGGVVYVLSCIRGILPIHWSANQPQLAIPVEIVFYNFLLPLILRKIRPSKKIAALYEWWFRNCARELRLTNFLFGDYRLQEKGTHTKRRFWARLISHKDEFSTPAAQAAADWLSADPGTAADFVRDGSYVRAPASDSVRIPKGHKVFLEVNKKNERIDGEEDKEKGMHGSKDDRFALVYIPPNFRARITIFIILLWLFAATTGVVFTIGPLFIGRTIIRPFSAEDVPANDLYALTIGVHICGGVAYVAAYFTKVRAWVKQHSNKIQAQVSFYFYPAARYSLGLLYLGVATCILPVAFSLLAELYFHVPIYAYLSSDTEAPELPASSPSYPMTLPPTLFLLQTWTVGLVLVRVILRDSLGDPETSQAARAIKAIVRRGYLDPDVQLATRALLLPATLLAALLWVAPLALGRILNTIFDVSNTNRRALVYRYSYPALAAMVLSTYFMHVMRRRVAVWRAKIRDEVYLIGERLHNYQEARESNSKGKNTARVRSERVEVG